MFFQICRKEVFFVFIFLFHPHIHPGVREYRNPSVKWSSEEYEVRACEGNMDPEKLRRYVENFDMANCQRFLDRADACREKLKVHANQDHSLRNSYLLEDKL